MLLPPPEIVAEDGRVIRYDVCGVPETVNTAAETDTALARETPPDAERAPEVVMVTLPLEPLATTCPKLRFASRAMEISAAPGLGTRSEPTERAMPSAREDGLRNGVRTLDPGGPRLRGAAVSDGPPLCLISCRLR